MLLLSSASISINLIILAQLIFVLVFGMYSGALNTFIIEKFEVAIRYRFAALAYSLGMGIIGGSAPLVASLLAECTQKYLFLLAYFVSSGIIAVLALRKL